MKDTIVELETAKLAKEKGFPVIERGFYIEGVFKNRRFSKDFSDWYLHDPKIQSAPTLGAVQKWLWETRTIHVSVIPIKEMWIRQIYFQFRIVDFREIGIEDVVMFEHQYSNSHLEYTGQDEALEEGLIKALNLIEIL